MDIARMSMALSQVQYQQQASLSVMKMAMGNAEQTGEAVQTLLNSGNVTSDQQPSHPHLGGKIDVKL